MPYVGFVEHKDSAFFVENNTLMPILHLISNNNTAMICRPSTVAGSLNCNALNGECCSFCEIFVTFVASMGALLVGGHILMKVFSQF